MIPSTQLFYIRYVSFSSTCFDPDYWVIFRFIELSCLHSAELGILSIYSCFGCAVNLDSYQLISKLEIYNILKYADNKMNKMEYKIAIYVAITVCTSI